MKKCFIIISSSTAEKKKNPDPEEIIQDADRRDPKCYRPFGPVTMTCTLEEHKATTICEIQYANFHKSFCSLFRLLPFTLSQTLVT
jgi:hypothetical protein